MAGQNNAVINVAGFHHLAMRVRDFDRSVAFYTQTLGMKPKIAWEKPPRRAVMLDLGNNNCLELFERPEQPAPVGDGLILHFALRTDNCDAALARARAAGCPVTMEPTDVDIDSTPGPTPVRIAFCAGPDGERIEFFQNRA